LARKLSTMMLFLTWHFICFMMVSDGLSKPNSSTNKKNGGRGTCKEEKSKEQRAREFFDMGISAELAWKQPNTPGRQKCFNLFKKWSQELLENYDMKINSRQIIAKQRNLISFQRLLFKLESQFDQFSNLLDEHRNNWEKQVITAKSKGLEPPLYEPRMEWVYFIRKLITDIAEMRDHLALTDYTLTVHEQSEEEIIKYLEELQERRAKYEQEYALKKS